VEILSLSSSRSFSEFRRIYRIRIIAFFIVLIFHLAIIDGEKENFAHAANTELRLQ
jgi:hypothetical protein